MVDATVFMIFALIVLFLHASPLLLMRSLYRNLAPASRFKAVMHLWLLVNFTPLVGAVYLLYHALTCGNGCFSGLFFIFTLSPAFVLIVMNIFVKAWLRRSNDTGTDLR